MLHVFFNRTVTFNMNGSHFYITLPSNASPEVFPDNKTTSYRVKLPQNINLVGNWEVGLYSISYPNSWYTLQDGFDTHIYYADKSGLFQPVIIDYGHYQSTQDIVKSVNKAFTRVVNDNIKLTYNPLNGKVTVQPKTGYQVFLLGRMSIILGFGGNDTYITKTTVSPYLVDLAAVSTIYVYCDIVEPQIVGDTSVRLLKSIPVQGKFGDVIAKTFTNIQYVPVQKKSFEDMEVLLRSDTGDPVPFERGKVIVTLHFKQQNSSYFS